MINCQVPTMSEDDLFYQASQQWDAGNVKQAFTLFKLAAEQGDSNAQNSLGYFFDTGKAVKKNTNKALFWYKKAARSGDEMAYANIGTIYRDRRNYDRARFWFLKALKSGDGDAALELARLYLGRKSKLGSIQASKYLRLALKSKSITEDSLDEVKLLLKRLEVSDSKPPSPKSTP